MEISHEPVHLRAESKKVTLSIEVSVPVIKCVMCQTEGAYVPSTIVRTTPDGAWSLNGILYPKGWTNGHCEACWEVQKKISGQQP